MDKSNERPIDKAPIHSLLAKGAKKGQELMSPAYLFVLNYDITNPKHSSRKGREEVPEGEREPDAKAPIIGNIRDEHVKQAFLLENKGDGAGYIDYQGNIIDYRVIIPNLDIARVPNIAVRFADLPKIESLMRGLTPHGIETKIGTIEARTQTMIAASYELPGTITYMLSQETGNIRRFYNGLPSKSTNPKEQRLIDYLMKHRSEEFLIQPY